MKSFFPIFFFTMFLAAYFGSTAIAANTPCDSEEIKDCKLGEGGWQKVGSVDCGMRNVCSLWKKNNEQLVCEEAGPATCKPRNGYFNAFKADEDDDEFNDENDPKEHVPTKEESDPIFEARKAKLKREIGTGRYLIQNGWNKIADCKDGHTWAYIIEKKNEKRICLGINAYAGPKEYPCVPFRGDMEHFRKTAQKADIDRKMRHEAEMALKLDDYNKDLRSGKRRETQCSELFPLEGRRGRSK